MDKHALAVLAAAESWEWRITKHIQQSGKPGGKYEAVTARLLSCFITQSQTLGGTLLNQFWHQLGECHSKLEENIGKLRLGPQFISSQQTLAVLFEGIGREEIDFEPIFNMAAELFTHLGVAFANPGGRKSMTYSVTDIVQKETDDLIRLAKEEGEFGDRKQELLKALSFKRDGTFCPLSAVSFRPFDPDAGYKPILAHIIPNSVHNKVCKFVS